MALFRRKSNGDPRQPQRSAIPGSTLVPPNGVWGPVDLPNPNAAALAGLPAASRARRLISESIAQMAPLDLWTPDGFMSEDTPPILERPNVTYTSFDFWDQAVAQAITHGNFLAFQADPDASGWPQQLVPVPWGVWFAYYDQAGYLVYAVNGEIYSREQMFHVRINATPNQPMGIGVVTQFRRSIGQALDQQNFVADTYRTGSVPAGVIKVKGVQEISQEQADSIIDQWVDNHAQGRRVPAVMPESQYEFDPLSWSPEDMQFLEARQFTVAEIAYMFGLDPTDLGAALQGASITYANIEQREVQRITDSYAPWMRRFEQELSDCIPGGTARFCVEHLLRTDSKTRAEVNQLNIDSGVTTADEARKVEGKRPLPEPATPEPEPGKVKETITDAPSGNGATPPLEVNA